MDDYKFLKDKKVALLITNIEKENDVRVYLGEIVEIESELCFINKTRGWNIALDLDKFKELQEVPETLKEILLNADFYLTMTLGNLPNDSVEGFKKTGMNWTD